MKYKDLLARRDKKIRKLREEIIKLETEVSNLCKDLQDAHSKLKLLEEKDG